MNGIKKILCPVEFTEEPNNRLIQWALKIAKTTGGELLLINVVAGYKEYSKIASLKKLSLIFPTQITLICNINFYIVKVNRLNPFF